MEKIKLSQLSFNLDGLIPTIVQEKTSNEILMLAYSNKQSLELSMKSQKAHFWSRSRKKFGLKVRHQEILLNYLIFIQTVIPIR